MSRHLLVGIALVLALLRAGEASAAFTYHMTNVSHYVQNGSNCNFVSTTTTITGGTPLDVAAQFAAFYDPSGCSGYPAAGYLNEPGLVWENGGYRGCAYKYHVPSNDSCQGTEIPIAPVTADPCWSAATGWVQTMYYWGGSLPSGFTCAPCPSPEVWNSATNSCVAPNCPDGQQYDTNINACRTTCTGTQVYLYPKSACVAQCPLNQVAAAYIVDGSNHQNDVSQVIAGCNTTAQSLCVADMGLGTGSTSRCFTFFAYGQISSAMASQCSGTGCATGYIGDPPVASPFGAAVSTWGSAAFSLTPSRLQFTCDSGQFEILDPDDTTKNRDIGGVCATLGDNPVGTNTEGATVQAIVGQTATLNATATTVGNASASIDQANDFISQLRKYAQDLKTDADQLAQKLQSAINWGMWSDPAPIASTDVYTPTNTGTLQDSINSHTSAGDTSAIANWGRQFVPVLPDSAPTCMSWTMNFPLGFGGYTFQPDCRVWDWIGDGAVLVCAVAAYAIVFGVAND